MNNRSFDLWKSTLNKQIRNWNYYVDFEKVFKNTEKIKIELNILNSLIGSKNIENDFRKIIDSYPNVLKVIPILIAVRESEILINEDKNYIFKFNKKNNSIIDYIYFMRKIGIFDLLENHIINNLNDYVKGVEVGLDSNARKNRIGKMMENIVEDYILKADYINNISYFKQIKIKEIERKFNINLSLLNDKSDSEKIFDFLIKTKNNIYAIETNFYGSQGSKLNETARSYKMLALKAKKIKGFKFVWITDGIGWLGAINNLKETFEVLEHLYNINDLKNNIIKSFT